MSLPRMEFCLYEDEILGVVSVVGHFIYRHVVFACSFTSDDNFFIWVVLDLDTSCKSFYNKP